MTGVELISLGLGTLSGGASILEANQQNKAIKRAAAVEKVSQDAAARQREEVTARQLLSVEGSIRATAAGRGLAGSNVETSLLGSSFESALLESRNIEVNRFLGNLSTDSRASSSLSSPFASGAGGFTTGFNIGTGLGDIFT